MVEYDDNILEAGPKGTIEYAIRADGSRPAKDGLDKLKKKSERKYSRFKMIFRQFVMTGELPKTKMDNYVGTKLRKFKPGESHPYRLPFFSIGNKHYITHLFKKRGKRSIGKNIKIAKEIMNEHNKG